MKIAIYGLGAIGGLFAARLARSGASVSAIARGATLDAVRRQGLELVESLDGVVQHSCWPVQVCENPQELGLQDLLILSVKTTALPEIAAQIAPLIGPQTTVLSAMNGIPWWFLHGLPQASAGLTLDRVDPQGRLSVAIPPQQVLGAVTHLSAAVPAPGVVRHVAGNRLIVGEPTGGAQSARAQAVIQTLRQAGFDVEETACVQQDIWFKLWGNMTMNPMSAITGATGDRILDDPLVRAFLSRCMREAAELGARIGLPIDADPESRHAITRQLGAFKTSMLQDVEAGKAVELDALVGVVLELAQQLRVPVPELETLFGIARLHAAVRGLYPFASAKD